MREKEIICDIVENLAVLSTSEKGWTKEINRISWNDDDPKFDLRAWSQDRTKPTKGVTMNEMEAFKLLKALQDYFNENGIEE